MEIAIARCTEDDFSAYFALRCEQHNIYWTGHKNAPDRDDLYHWYVDQLKRNDRIMFIARDRKTNNQAGYLYVDLQELPPQIAEISHGVAKAYMGLGIGTQLVAFVIESVLDCYPHVREIIAWVAHDNLASVKTFEKNGFVATNYTKNMWFALAGEEKVMLKYQNSLKSSL